MVHWEDLKADAKDVFNEFKRHKIGWIGVGLISFMVIIGLLAPVVAPGVPEDWRRGAARWDPNPAHAPPVWVDWITRDDHARQEELREWENYPRPSSSRTGYARADAETRIEATRLFDKVGTRNITLLHDDIDSEEGTRTTEVKEREAPANLDVSNFMVTPVEGDFEDRQDAPLRVDISADLRHNGTFEAGGAEEREFGLDRTEYEELEPYPEEGDISSELRTIFVEEIDYLEEGDLEGAELSEQEGEWYIVVDGERELRLGIPDEHSFNLGDDYEEEYGIEEGAVPPGLRRTFEAEIGDPPYETILDRYEFNITDFGDLEEGSVPEWLRDNFTAEGHELPGEVELVREDDEWRIYLRKAIVDGWGREVIQVEEVQYRLEKSDEKLYVYEFGAEMYQEHGQWWINLFDKPEYRIDEDGEVWDVDDFDIYGKEILDVELELPEGETLREEWADVEVTKLEPGEEKGINAQHLFRFDGEYGIHIGSQSRFFRIGVGFDFSIDDFRVVEVDEEAMEYLADAEITNLVDEERTIRMRIDWMDEDGDYQRTVDTRDFDVDPLDTASLTWEETLDWHGEEEEGSYVFVIGNQEETALVVEAEDDENEEDTETAALSSSSGEEKTSHRSTSTQQDGQVSIRTFEVPDELTQGEFGTIEIELENSRLDEQVVELQIDGETFRTIRMAPGGEYDRKSYTFTYDMQADKVPREIFMEWSGYASRYHSRRITVQRPDSEELSEFRGFRGTDGKLELEYLRRGDRVGEFSESITTFRRMRIRENLREDITSYFRDNDEIEDPPEPGVEVINPIYTIFGEANENWLQDPDPLKGEYEITITLEGSDLEVYEDETAVHIGGNVYGIFGTDRYRRDIALGWIWGARYGLYAGGIVALVTIAISTSYGMTSAYYGGWVDELMSRLQEIAMGIPTLPILIILLEFWSRSINVFVLVYALLMWRGAARVIRARGLQVAQDTYIEAAESLGSGSGRIIFRHMIPQILPYAIAQAALIVPVVIMAEAGMHILGLGDPNVVTWGTILNDARGADAVMNYQESWFWVLFPGVGMMLIGFGFISTGMAIERIINPEMQQR